MLCDKCDGGRRLKKGRIMMTREEAIIKLENKRDELCSDCIHIVGWCDNHCRFSKAIDIAIEALRQPTSFNMIDKQVAIDAVRASYDEILDFKSTGRTIADSVEDIISNLSPAQPEREMGEWIPHKSKFGGPSEKVYTCSKCGHNIGFRQENYCPHCGVKMIKGE